MLKLLKKELILGNTLQNLIFLLCSVAMLVIPNYPVYVGPFYITLCIMLTFALNQNSHDILYTVLLPVKKSDTVRARFLYAGLLELITLFILLVFDVLRAALHFPQNAAGTNLTVGAAGLQLVIFALFNLLFLGNVYKNPLKPGLRFIGASAGYLVCYFLFEFPVWSYYGFVAKDEGAGGAELPLIPAIGRYITQTQISAQLRQLPLLAAALVLFALSWLISFRRGARQFEAYDL